jgi:hypothetical protein
MVSRIENGGRCSEKCVRSQRICGVLADCCGWRSSWLVALVCRTTHAIAGGEGQKNELLMCASSCLVYAFMLNDRGVKQVSGGIVMASRRLTGHAL